MTRTRNDQPLRGPTVRRRLLNMAERLDADRARLHRLLGDMPEAAAAVRNIEDARRLVVYLAKYTDETLRRAHQATQPTQRQSELRA